jgi:hypothetical protein
MTNFAWTGLDPEGRRHWWHAWPHHPELGDTVTIEGVGHACDGWAEEPSLYAYENPHGYVVDFMREAGTLPLD